MRRLSIALLAAASTFAFGQIASAADLPSKAPAYTPPPPVWNWTGFYIGVNGGFSGGKAETDFNAAPVTVVTNVGPAPHSFDIPGFVGSESARPNGVIGGGQIGYNWQFSPNWVVGLEADIQASGEKGSKAFSNPFSFTFAGFPVTGTAQTDYEAKISWFGTVRGRIGYAWDRVMVYGTGGLAYGEVKLDGTRTVSGVFDPPPKPDIPFSIAHAIGHSHVNTGWTAGVGAEVALAGNWTAKFEYLYIDLGSLDDSDVAITPRIDSVTGGQTLTHTTFTDNIFRVGLNYKFGGPY